MRAAILLFLAALPAWPQSDAGALLEARTMERLEALARSTNGVVGIAAMDLTDGREFCFHCDTSFPTASTIKVPVLAELMRQNKMGAVVSISAADVVEGSKEFEAALAAGQPVRAKDLALMMIRSSDNAATNKLIELTGMASVNRFLDELDLPAIRLRRKMIDTAAAARNEENVATPRDMVRLAAKLHRGRVVSPQASADILSMMGLVNGEIRAAVPKEVQVSAKTGALSGVRCEFGVVQARNRPFAIAVYSTFLEGTSPVAEAARILYNHFQLLGRSNRAGRFLN